MIYELFGSDGSTMKRCDVPENAEKNNLPIGTILHLNGYSDPDYVIVKNEGVKADFSDYGASYLTVDMESKTFSKHQAYSLKYEAERRDNRIQTYITDKTVSAEEVLELFETATRKQKEMADNKAKQQAETDQLIAEGRELFKKYIPASAKALIIAIHEIDDCDTMTDYFATKYGEKVVLGYSTHTRDIFSEMRKYADLIPETAHLAKVPQVDSNNEEKTPENKSWWTPKDEHREKYSMGAGYYLKDANRYSTGWKIEKQRKWSGDWDTSIYISLAKRCVFTDKPEQETPETVTGTEIRRNEDKGGLEIAFPSKPGPAVRNWLKDHGFRWSRFNKVWYAKYDQTLEELAKKELL